MTPLNVEVIYRNIGKKPVLACGMEKRVLLPEQEKDAEKMLVPDRKNDHQN